MKIVTSEVMRKIDEKTIKSGQISGYTLMQRAGQKSVLQITDFLKIIHENFKKKIVVVCGAGNNAGDGYVIASELYRLGFEVRVLAKCGLRELQGDALLHASEMDKEVAVGLFEEGISFDRDEVIVDCLLGTGLSRPVKGLFADVIHAINNSGSLVISIDIASGLNGTTGDVCGVGVVADMTIAVGLPKSGFFESEGPCHTGRLKCVDIGFIDEIINQFPYDKELIDRSYVDAIWRRRAAPSHKYQCGTVVVVGGSQKYKGAIALTAKAAARAGAGMVTCAYPGVAPELGWNSLISVSLESESGCLCGSSVDVLKELLAKPKVVAIGPGMLGVESEKLSFETVLFSQSHLVIDAGALAFVHEYKEQIAEKPSVVVLTPHAGEFAKLVTRFSLEGSQEEMALELSCRLQAIVILKGQFTRIYFPDKSILINSSGCVTLATAGSGDVLSGVIASFLSQERDFKLAVSAAVYVHGLTGELSEKGVRSTLADDLVESLPEVLRSLSALC